PVHELLDHDRTGQGEEFMDGYEVSVFAVTDGIAVQRFGHASDYKRAFDGDEGPNTGGMGAVCPALKFDKALEDRAYAEIIEPTLGELKKRGITYRGVLYAGLMITSEGPKLVEYNCRFGDPECQLIMRCLRSDVIPSLWGAATGRLGGIGLDWMDGAGVLVTYAAKGYPGAVEKGSRIEGLDEAASDDNAVIFHAGTAMSGDALTAAGGRVLSVTGFGADVIEAKKTAYSAVEAVTWPEGFYRTDIASST
ncbi:MAG: phosphoribosylglycinamide synthetase C domain-containing protein, partial [Pseudomonadota bacterium]